VDQDTLQTLLREAVRETVAEVLQVLMELDRPAFLREGGGGEKKDLSYAVPGHCGPVGWGLRGLPAVPRVPEIGVAVPEEHQPDRTVHWGDWAGDEGARPQVCQCGGGVQASVSGVRAAGGEVGRKEAQGFRRGEGGAGGNASGVLCVLYTHLDT